MSSNVNIKYVNHSMNLDQPSVFVFTKNEIPSFDALREGVAWRVINKVGRGSSCDFTFPISTEISASWNDGCCRTAMLPAVIGSRFCVAKDSTGIVLRADGNASSTTAIDVCSDIQTPGGVSVSLYRLFKMTVFLLRSCLCHFPVRSFFSKQIVNTRKLLIHIYILVSRHIP